MLIKINLLHPQTKEKIAHNTVFIALINNLLVLSITIGFSSLCLFIGASYLNDKTDQLNTIKIQTPLDQQIMDINMRLEKIKTIQADYLKWSRLLTNLFNLIPPGNTLKNLRLDKDNQELTISGHADTRDNFLALKNNLENADLVASVESPIANLLRQVDIDFSLQAKLNP